MYFISNATQKELKLASKKRSLFSNKYSNGRLLIIGGSSSFYGAPILSFGAAYQSLAALRVGSGYTMAFVPQKILETARSLSPNTIIRGLGKDTIVFNADLKRAIGNADVVLIGMGIGHKAVAQAKRIIEYSLSRSKKVIADADAIEAVKLIRVKKPWQLLITPHDGEFYRLTGKKVGSKKLKARIASAKSAARKMNALIVLKGHQTIITDGTKVKLSNAKTAVLATMGTGDVLSGIIAGYAAIGNDLFRAAAAGVYLHSKIGDMLYKEKGNHIIATDVIAKIPEALKRC